jgi:hypothetical protein
MTSIFDSKAIRWGYDLSRPVIEHIGIGEAVNTPPYLAVHSLHVSIVTAGSLRSLTGGTEQRRHARWKAVGVSDSTIGCIVRISWCDRILVACCVLHGAHTDALQVWSCEFRYSGMGVYM